MAKKMSLIGTKPGGTSPAVAGTRIRVAHIAEMYRQLQDEATIGAILRELRHLTAEQVEAAIEYWRAHPEEIQAELDADAAVIEELEKSGGVLVLPLADH